MTAVIQNKNKIKTQTSLTKYIAFKMTNQIKEQAS